MTFRRLALALLVVAVLAANALGALIAVKLLGGQKGGPLQVVHAPA